MPFVSAVAFVAATLGLQASPQPAGRVLSGIVEDPLGGAIASATVTVICGVDTFVTSSGASGEFTLDQLPSAHCLVVGEREQFAPVTLEVDLTNRESAYVRLLLSIAGLATEIVVTPARGEQEQSFQVPEAVAVTTREELESRPFQILPQALREEPGVLVQQTTTAQGSPFIRGFSAQRIVYLMDGVRFNTSTFRTGATQYLSWINPAIVDRLEVVRGPSSVQYGSDALGGTVNVLSLTPQLGSAGRQTSGSLEGKFGSADLSGGVDAIMLVQTPSASVRFGGASRAIGELRTGRGLDSHSALTRFLGLPSRTLYASLPDTGFVQSGGYAAATLKAGADATVNAVYLHEEQFGVSRYDRIIGGDGWHRSEFEPQRLDFGYVRYQRGRTGFLDRFSTSFSVNRQQDDRLEQNRPTSQIERQQGHVTAFGYQAQGSWLLGGRHALTFGGEVYDEYIGSGRTLEGPITGAQQAVRPRIPDGTRYTSTGMFVQTASALVPGRLTVRGGLRYGHFLFRTRADPAFGVARERVPANAITFHTGSVVRLTDWINATFTVSRGFRAANAFDLGAIGISGGGFELTPGDAASLGAQIGDNDGADATTTGQPVEGLTPESAIAVEAGLKFRTTRLAASITVFNLELVDIIQRRTIIFSDSLVGTTLAGFTVVRQDDAGRAFVREDPRPIVTRVNVDRARVLGVEADAQLRLNGDWLVATYFSMVNGHELGTDTFLRRMPPPFGGFRVKWEPRQRSFWIEGVTTFVFAQTRLSPGDLSDARIGARRSIDSIADFFSGTATDIGLVQGGRLVATGETLDQVQARVLGQASASALFTRTPGFIALGARTGWRPRPNLEVSLIADNLTDRNYRWHGSGVDAPGVSVQLKTRYSF